MEKTGFGTAQSLVRARTMAHAAAQILYRAAVANVDPMPAHEHTNLGWNVNLGVFQTHALDDSGVMAELRLAPLTLRIADKELVLAGETVEDAVKWLDDQLSDKGLKQASAVRVSYDLPDDVSGLGAFEQVDGLEALAAWFGLAATSLEALSETTTNIEPGASPVRCWPHHFDIATYVSLEAGDAEVARGIGVGMSPGDESYDQPYFYVNPWPHPDPNTLPEAIKPGHWHTEGFVGMIATGNEILSLADIRQGTIEFLQASFDTGRRTLGM